MSIFFLNDIHICETPAFLFISVCIYYYIHFIKIHILNRYIRIFLHKIENISKLRKGFRSSPIFFGFRCPIQQKPSFPNQMHSSDCLQRPELFICHIMISNSLSTHLHIVIFSIFFTGFFDLFLAICLRSLSLRMSRWFVILRVPWPFLSPDPTLSTL